MRNFLIDTDTACDDAVAIMMALPGSSLPGVREIACAQGFATSVTQAGVSTLKIRQQTGHASHAMLARYVSDGSSLGNPSGLLL
jgi:inosine-uridine nucleoside N-ribohydrolase